MRETPVLHATLFGGLRLTCDGQPLTAFAQPRLGFLLARLLLHRGEVLSRQQLAYSSWPDTSEEQARTNLRNLIHRLRTALPDPVSHLTLDRHSIGWRAASPALVDVELFSAHLEAAAVSGQAGDAEAEIQSLHRAVDLYAGPLLPECYEDWVQPERDRLGGQFLAAAERLVEQLRATDRLTEAYAYAQRIVEADPLHEAGYRHLMQLRATAGDRTGVVRVFLTCEGILKRELDAPVSDETRATYVRCLRIAAEAAWEAGERDRTVGPAKGAVPRELTSLLGREHLVNQVRELTAHERLVTLTGLGGVGKTRLAQRVAHELEAAYPDGLVWVDLAPVADPGLVPVAIGTALGLREGAVRSIAETIAAYLADKHALLVLDNCERLVDVLRTLVHDLLLAAPQLHLLITSQRSLGIAEEQTFRVPPLRMPEQATAATPGAAIAANPAVQLFVERARAILPGFVLTPAAAAAVAQICRQLSGIPLAIELAATRVRTLTPQQIADRLENALALLARPASGGHWRQQTLGAAMDWTHGLLSGGEQLLFRRLAVFTGVFTLEAVEDVCATAGLSPREILELFAGLADKSLVEGEAVGNAMWFHLHEVVRQYAAARLLDSGEQELLRTRHLAYYARFAAEADAQTVGAHQGYWLDLLEAQHDNIRAALDWSIRRPEFGEQGLLIAGSLHRFWSHRGHSREGLYWTTALIRATDHFSPSLGRAHALRTAGHLSFDRGEYPAARGYYERALAVARAVGHKPNIAAIVRGLGAVAHSMGDYATAIACYEESMQICRELGDELGESTSLGNLGLAALENGDPARARVYLEQCLALRRRQGDLIGIAYALHILADAAVQQGSLQEGETLNLEALQIRRELGDKWGVAYSTDSLGVLTWRCGRAREARAYFRESVRLFDELGNRQGLLDTVGHLAAMLGAEGRWMDAAVLLTAATTAREALSLALPPHEQGTYRGLAAGVDAALAPEVAAAARLHGRSLTLSELAVYALEL